MKNYTLKFNGIEATENTKEFLDAFTTTEVSLCVGIYARLLNNILIESNVIYKKYDYYLPYENISKELYILKEYKSTDKYSASIRWTELGKSFIIKDIDELLAKCGKRTKLQFKKFVSK